MKYFSYSVDAFLPLLVAALVALGFIFGLGLVFFIAAGVFTFCALAMLFAVTAPIWASLAALVYAGLLLIVMPFHSLYTVLRKSHSAS